MITVSLTGSQAPQLVMVVVDEAPDGEWWTVTGSGGGMSWTVPGGEGVGDGGQLVLVDNRAPLNTPVEYTFTSETVTETSDPVTVVQLDGDMVIQSLDGQQAVPVIVRDGAQNYTIDPNVALYPVSGRRNPVVRYGVAGSPVGAFTISADLSQTDALDAVLSPGGPVLWRFTAPALDLPMVSVVTVTGISTRGNLVGAFRDWELSYVRTDDPYLDQRLGAFTWDTFDAAMGGRTWDEFDTIFAGMTFDQFDTFDWSTLL